jgi:hypothetical protein
VDSLRSSVSGPFIMPGCDPSAPHPQKLVAAVVSLTTQTVEPLPVAGEAPPGCRLASAAAIEGAAAVVSAALAAIVIVVLTLHIPVTNAAHSDIVGYPLFADFNADLYSNTWYLAVVGWPLLTLVLFLGMRGALRSAGLVSRVPLAIHISRAQATPAPVAEPEDRGTERLAATARVVVVGLIWGLTGAIVRDNVGIGFWRDLVVFAAIYVVGLAALTGVLCTLRAGSLSREGAARVASTLNALSAALTVVGLIVVSQVTVLVTLSDNVNHPMHWLPLALGLPITAVLTGLAGVGLWRARHSGIGRVRTVERRALFLVAVPVTLFLLTAVLVGGQGAMDVFELGQQITTLRLLHLGEFPWRDFLPFHGLLVDTLSNALGYKLLSPSAWGAIAGGFLLIIPLTWVTLYLFAYRVVGGSWAAILTVFFLIFNSTAMVGDGRLFAWPLVLILLAFTFDRKSAMAAFGTGVALALFVVLVPEATYAVPACAVALLAHDAYHARWRRRLSVVGEFRLSLWTLAGGVVVAAALFVVLASAHAVGGFVDYYLTLIPGHDLQGSIPISWGPPFNWNPVSEQFVFWVVAPGLAVILGLGIVVARLRLGRALGTTEFLIVASGVFTVPYYGTEFLNRADQAHSSLAYAGAIPLLLLVGWEVLRWANGWVRSQLKGSRAGRLRWPLLYVAAVIAAITTSTSLPTLVGAAPADFRANAPAEPWLPTLGYMDYSDQGVYTDLATFLAAFLEPGQEIYDFSNQPGLYFYILDYRPASGRFFAGEDFSQATQDETIADLKVNRPEFVVMYGNGPGALPSWDGMTNSVREYDISQYLLDHYRPFAEIDGQIIYVEDGSTVTIPASVRSEFGSRLSTTDLPFAYPACGWGYIPEFLKVQPSSGESGVVVGGASAPAETWSLSEPPGQTWSDYHWIQLTIAAGAPAASFTIDDQEVNGEAHDVTFQTLAGAQAAYRFPIGACTQWHGYSLPAVQLTSSQPLTVSQVELLP